MTTLEHVGSCKGGNTIPLDGEGRPYHFGCCAKEIANEFLITSCYSLAEEIAKLFEEGDKVFVFRSNRGYTTYTGTYKGKRLSVCAFGIGFAMIDFLVREVRAITSGKLTFIQLGAAPTPAKLELGTAVNVRDAVAYELDFNEFTKDNKCPYKFFKKPVNCDDAVFQVLNEGLKNAGIKQAEGRVASNPSFSSGVNAPLFKSGGTGAFDFKTEGLVEKVIQEEGPIATFEMDTYPLYWIAGREVNHNIRTGCVSVVSSDLEGNVLPADELRKRQVEVAKVILEELGKLQ